VTAFPPVRTAMACNMALPPKHPSKITIDKNIMVVEGQVHV